MLKYFTVILFFIFTICTIITGQSLALDRTGANGGTSGSETSIKIENVTKLKLDNGLTVIVKEDHSSPVATVNVWVKTGYFNEEDEWTGISHMLEHMFFKGTQTRPVGKIQDEVKSVGGYWNASTYYDHTNYYIVVPSSAINKALDI